MVRSVMRLPAVVVRLNSIASAIVEILRHSHTSHSINIVQFFRFKFSSNSFVASRFWSQNHKTSDRRFCLYGPRLNSMSKANKIGQKKLAF